MGRLRVAFLVGRGLWAWRFGFFAGEPRRCAALDPVFMGVIPVGIGWVGFWLWRREYRGKRSRIVWTVFGLALGLWAIGLGLLMIVVTDRCFAARVVGEVDDPDLSTG